LFYKLFYKQFDKSSAADHYNLHIFFVLYIGDIDTDGHARKRVTARIISFQVRANTKNFYVNNKDRRRRNVSNTTFSI